MVFFFNPLAVMATLVRIISAGIVTTTVTSDRQRVNSFVHAVAVIIWVLVTMYFSIRIDIWKLVAVSTRGKFYFTVGKNLFNFIHPPPQYAQGPLADLLRLGPCIMLGPTAKGPLLTGCTKQA